MSQMLRRSIYNLISRIYSRILAIYWKNQYELLRKKYSIPKSFKFNGYGIGIQGEGKIRLGENTYIGSNSYIQSEKGCMVSIGSLCAISHNVRIYTSSYVANQNFYSPSRQTKMGDVIIGDAVWIGANVLINPGVIIGSNSVIGANSVVANDIPNGSIYGGVPAKLIRYKSVE